MSDGIFTCHLFCSTANLDVIAATSGDWKYYIHGDGDNKYAVVSEYTGTDASITIPSKLGGKPVRQIDSFAFERNTYIVSVKIPDSVWMIGESAFSYCPNLKKISGAKNVVRIDSGAFTDCEKLAFYPFNNKITYIGRCAFANTAITRLDIPNSVAQVNSVGEITAVGTGNATIVATTTSGIRKQINVTVAETVIKQKEDCTLLKGDTISCKPTVYAGKEIRKDIKITYKSLNPNVATVTSGGTIKAVGIGTAEIVISYLETNYSFEIKVVSILAKPKVSVYSSGSKKLKLSWNTIGGAEGYQIQYSTSSKFKSKKMKYGAWSKKISCKTK